MTDISPPLAPARPPQVEAWLTMDRLQGVLSRRVHNLLAGHGLTRPQYQVLRRLTESGRSAAHALAAELGSTPGNLTGVLDRLEGAGLVTRERGDADRRCVWLSATPQGHALMERCVPELRQDIQQGVFGGLSGDEVDALLGLLRRVEEHLTTLPSPAPFTQEQSA